MFMIYFFISRLAAASAKAILAETDSAKGQFFMKQALKTTGKRSSLPFALVSRAALWRARAGSCRTRGAPSAGAAPGAARRSPSETACAPSSLLLFVSWTN